MFKKPPVHILRHGLYAALLTLLAACGQQQAASEYHAPAAAQSAAYDAVEESHAAEGKETATVHDSAVLSQEVEGRQLVLAADLEFQTDNVRQTTAAIENMTVSGGGFVQQSAIHTAVLDEQDYPQQDGTVLRIRRYVHHGDMTVRVPRDHAAAFVQQLQEHIRFLDGQHFSATDVSLDIRRQQLAAERERALSARLGEVADSDEDSNKKGTGSVVQRQFDARAAAEYARLQQAYWQDQVDFATLRLQFRQPEALVRQNVPDTRQLARQYRPGFWVSAKHMLGEGWYGLIQAGLLAIALWPLWLLLAAVVTLWRWLRRRKRQRQARGG
ncbi:hypothetical protein L1281_001791 [Neisseria sp. HSC-16F19]|nr:DUF4349 domain-containing protein [Neisseria sp. HSC-16F19]MCP2041197.1 hypothetical protein [Neisseria sp. HSC-16F19]